MMTYTFTQEEAERANAEWGCNCGPTALAFALQIPLDDVRGKIPGFEEKRYTSPGMMRQALDALGVRWSDIRPADTATMFQRRPCLVRVQWTGPWTAPGANPRWAYWQTHWICTYTERQTARVVFDCNGGITGFSEWQGEIVPLLTAATPRADGGWFPTHVWRITGRAGA